MKKYKCEFCGGKVFKQYERGVIVVRGLLKIEENYFETISHNCSFVHNTNKEEENER